MILLKQNTGLQQVFLPKVLGGSAADAASLVLSSTISEANYECSIIEATTDNMYYALTLALPEDMPVGEYSYILYDADAAWLGCGLVFVGDFEDLIAAPTSGVETITIKQYGE